MQSVPHRVFIKARTILLKGLPPRIFLHSRNLEYFTVVIHFYLTLILALTLCQKCIYN
jgi:hypothetical protein